jgi:hypothetical protein
MEHRRNPDMPIVHDAFRGSGAIVTTTCILPPERVVAAAKDLAAGRWIYSSAVEEWAREIALSGEPNCLNTHGQPVVANITRRIVSQFAVELGLDEPTAFKIACVAANLSAWSRYTAPTFCESSAAATGA